MAKDNEKKTVELPYEAIEIIDLAKNLQKTLEGLATKEHKHQLDQIMGLAEALGAKADAKHTHEEYAPKEHTHEEYAPKEHNHTAYAGKNHKHPDYAPKEHTHDDYALKEHSHEQLEKAVAALDKDLAAERLNSLTVVLDEAGLDVDELEVSERTRRFILRTGDSPVRITDLIRGTKTARYFDEPSRIVPADTRFTVSVTVTNALGKDPAAFIQYGCAFLNGPIA